MRRCCRSLRRMYDGLAPMHVDPDELRLPRQPLGADIRSSAHDSDPISRAATRSRKVSSKRHGAHTIADLVEGKVRFQLKSPSARSGTRTGRDQTVLLPGTTSYRSSESRHDQTRDRGGCCGFGLCQTYGYSLISEPRVAAATMNARKPWGRLQNLQHGTFCWSTRLRMSSCPAIVPLTNRLWPIFCGREVVFRASRTGLDRRFEHVREFHPRRGAF